MTYVVSGGVTGYVATTTNKLYLLGKANCTFEKCVAAAARASATLSREVGSLFRCEYIGGKSKHSKQLQRDPCEWRRGVGKRCKGFYGGLRYVYFRVRDVEVPVVFRGVLVKEVVPGRVDKYVEQLCAAVVKYYRGAHYLECAAFASRSFATSSATQLKGAVGDSVEG